jgi:hypothetical protein
MKRTLWITTAVAVLLGAGAITAVAHDGSGRGGPKIEFAQLDADGDGKITQAEMDAHKAARFAEADTNGDGALDAEEMMAHAAERMKGRMGDRMGKMIERHDTNGDGKLSMDEMASDRGNRMFERLDEDGDGAISAEEFAEMGEQMGKRRHGWGGMGGHGGHGHDDN